ncbi:MAG: glycosyltransferase family 4 protein [Candidatus Thorarchaeota archaeon]
MVSIHKVQDGKIQSVLMRILHLCDSLNPAGLGGYESYLHYLSREMSRHGHESFIVTQASSRESLPRENRDAYEIWTLPGNYLEARKWEFLALTETERSSQVSKLFTDDDLEENVRALCTQLSKVIQKLQPDIIHAHSTYIVFNRVLQSLLHTGALGDIAMVATIHGLSKSLILPGGANTTDYEQLAEFCPFDRILAVSETVAMALRDLLKNRGKDDCVQRLYIGIDLDVFKPEPNIEKKWDIAFLGRLEPMKGVDIFPEMLKLLQVSHPSLKMVLTGEGSLKQSMLQDLDTYEVANLVEYLGVIAAEVVPHVINASRIFLYPSRREPFGLSVLEGMACEVPVITANVYGPSEVVTHEQDGYLITPGNPRILADAVDRLLTDSELYDRIRRNSRATAERFDIRLHVPRLLEIYAELQDTTHRLS